MSSSPFQELVFWALAVTTVGGALLVVLLRDMFRAALMLVVSFLGVAGLFVLLSAEFLAVVQVIIYAGAISVLLIFAVMLTRDVMRGNRGTAILPIAVTVSLILGGLLAWGILQSEWELIEQVPEEVFLETPQRLGELLVREFVLPFEIAGVVLLAAVIGALALVRER